MTAQVLGNRTVLDLCSLPNDFFVEMRDIKMKTQSHVSQSVLVPFTSLLHVHAG